MRHLAPGYGEVRRTPGRGQPALRAWRPPMRCKTRDRRACSLLTGFFTAGGASERCNAFRLVRWSVVWGPRPGAPRCRPLHPHISFTHSRRLCKLRKPYAERWRADCPQMVRQLERGLTELLSFLNFQPSLRRLRTTNLIERVLVKVQRRTRPTVCFVNADSVDPTIYSFFRRFNLEWPNRTLRIFTEAA